MHRIKSRTIIFATVLAAVPLTGAYAAKHHKGALDEPVAMDTSFDGSHLRAALNQLQGVEQGIADAKQGNLISSAEAHKLTAWANQIRHGASRTGYRQVLQQVDDLNTSLLNDTGQNINMGDGSDGGSYPNG